THRLPSPEGGMRGGLVSGAIRTRNGRVSDTPPDRPDPLEAIDALAGLLAAWGRQTLSAEHIAALSPWAKAGAADRQAFRTILRPLFAGRPGPEQRLWEALRRRALMRGVPEAQASEGIYEVLWESMMDRLA